VTLTMPRTEVASRTSGGIDLLLAVIGDVLDVCTERDPDTLHSSTSPGSALVSLAALARTAVGLLGGTSGTSLIDGPGVVVVRDLAAAHRVLGAAARGATGERRREAERDPLLRSVARRCATLTKVVTDAA
jgi:hypothetical protein